ncbi:MAG: c-type cytochrome [Candidatus Methylomirabilia bacterium]
MRRGVGPWGRALLVFLLVGAVCLLPSRGVSGHERPRRPEGRHEETRGGHGDREKKGHVNGHDGEHVKNHHEEKGHRADHGVEGHREPGRRGDSPEQQGRQLVVRFHCNACHLVSEEIKHEHHGGHEQIAPNLSFEGDKVRPEWLFDFLKGPHRVRPWLGARMPNFRLTDREALALTEHFITDLRDRTLAPLPGRFRYRTQNLQETLKAGARLVSEDYLDCFTCHQLGDRKPQGDPDEWGPDLALASGRLRPEWIVRWLMDPQQLQPGTKMPTYFSDESSGPEDVLGGDEGRQIIALRDYLLNLGPDTISSRYAEAKKRYPDITTGEGWWLMQTLNCGGCHDVGRMHERHEVAPPLAHAGSRVRRQWLVDFLLRPTVIRPVGYIVGAPARMPDFRLSRQEAEAITAFLMSQKMPKMPRWWRAAPQASVVEEGRALYQTWNCTSCHRWGDRSPGGPIAAQFEGPDLSRVGQRLKPDHLLFWLKGGSGTVDTHPIVPTFGLSDNELQALVAYLMTRR